MLDANRRIHIDTKSYTDTATITDKDAVALLHRNTVHGRKLLQGVRRSASYGLQL